MPVVTDPADPRLDDYRGLRDPATRIAYERAHGVFVVEGVLAIGQLLASAYGVRSLLLTDAARERLGLDAADATTYVATRDVIEGVAGFDVHRGALAVATRPPPADSDAIVDRAAIVLLLERLNDHENVGGLFRVARALGADAVLLDPETCDPLYRRAVRVSLGHVLHVPFARVPSTAGGLDLLRRNGFTTYALTPTATDSIAGVTAGGRNALLLGAEGPGLRPETVAAADRAVRIPMRPGVDSLNVVTAAAVALHRLCA